MVLNYVKANLFSLEAEDVVFAHCIASDFGMYGGIAKQFVQRYDMREKLWNKCDKVKKTYRNQNGGFGSPIRASLIGKAVKVDNTYNLITKEMTSDKPTRHDLGCALFDLRNQMDANDDKHLAIPKIGCGIDGFDWNTVLALIYLAFGDSDIEITVCVLDESEIPIEAVTSALQNGGTDKEQELQPYIEVNQKDTKIGATMFSKGTSICKCRACKEFITRSMNYCANCGHKIDWLTYDEIIDGGETR